MRIIPAFIAALATALPFAAAAQSADGKPVYNMKAEDPRTGSHLPRTAAVFSMPYDKPYSELSAADKQRVRDVYENMAPDDEPPFPIRGYKSIFKTLSVIQRKLGVEGDLDIAVIVAPDGTGTGVKVYKSPDPQVTQVVAALMMQETYKPALCKGQPCAQEFPLRVSFTLER